MILFFYLISPGDVFDSAQRGERVFGDLVRYSLGGDGELPEAAMSIKSKLQQLAESSCGQGEI
jgi:hypothetical protein